MIKFVRHKNRENSLKASKNFLRKKRESNDSGTESDGELLDVENKRHLDVDMETSLSSCTDANSPTTDTACSSESSAIAAAAMMCHHQTSSSSSCAHLMYDQHSSEEELEVINGPSAVAAAAHTIVTTSIAATSSCASRLSNRGCTSSLDTEAPYDERATTSSNLKRSSSTLMVENRKRSLAHSSDDELRNSLEPILTPVNFCTSPPLEAFKPNRSHMMFRSTTPLILSEARCGIENIKLCDNSVNEENGDGNGSNSNSNTSKCAKLGASASASASASGTASGGGGNENEPSVIKACSSSLKMSNSSHHIYQPQPKYNFHYNSSRSSPASTTGLDMEVRSVSPPAKLFHCAISPRRRPSNNATASGGTGSSGAGGDSANAAVTVAAAAATQRLHRPHRPCLDFDKMQQVSL